MASFAFVEFTSKEEAKKAFEALSASTHLYGRRLVISFAKDEEGVAVLQEKTIRDMKRLVVAPHRVADVLSLGLSHRAPRSLPSVCTSFCLE